MSHSRPGASPCLGARPLPHRTHSLPRILLWFLLALTAGDSSRFHFGSRVIAAYSARAAGTCAPGAARDPFPLRTRLILTLTLQGGRHRHPHFTSDKAETGRSSHWPEFTEPVTEKPSWMQPGSRPRGWNCPPGLLLESDSRGAGRGDSGRERGCPVRHQGRPQRETASPLCCRETSVCSFSPLLSKSPRPMPQDPPPNRRGSPHGFLRGP